MDSTSVSVLDTHFSHEAFKKAGVSSVTHSKFPLAQSYSHVVLEPTRGMVWHILCTSVPSHFFRCYSNFLLNCLLSPVFASSISINQTLHVDQHVAIGVNIYLSAVTSHDTDSYPRPPSVPSPSASYSPDPPLTVCHDRPLQYKTVFFVPPLSHPQSVHPSLPS